MTMPETISAMPDRERCHDDVWAQPLQNRRPDELLDLAIARLAVHKPQPPTPALATTMPESADNMRSLLVACVMRNEGIVGRAAAAPA